MKKSIMKKLMVNEIQSGIHKHAPVEEIKRIDNQIANVQQESDFLMRSKYFRALPNTVHKRRCGLKKARLTHRN